MNKRKFLYIASFFIIIILVYACNNKLVTTKNIVIFPSPPDTTRIQFLTKISNYTDVAGKRNKFAKFLLGEGVEKPINKPYGVAIKNGKIYVCDSYIKGLEIMNLKKKSFEYFIPSGLGALKSPINCFVDDNDYIYVADAERKQIVVFDDKRNYVNAFGETEKFKPTDVFIYDNKVWVVNLSDHKINVYSKETPNKLVSSFPEAEEGTHDYLYLPTNIFVNQNAVYVCDMGDSRIKKYSHDGKLQDTLGSYGRNVGQFIRPKGIAVDRESNIYVVDAGFENVQIFDKNNKVCMFFGGPYTGPGYMYLPAKVIIDYDNISYFQKFVDPAFKLKYLIIVSNQYGPDKINIYGYVEPVK